MSYATLSKIRCARLGTTAAMALAVGSVLVGTPGHAAASPAEHANHAVWHSQTAARVRAAKERHVLRVAQAQKGKPYSYGAAGPHAFDCSGLVRYVYLKALDRSLPHSAEEQKQASQRIWHRRNLEVGDLVFETTSSGYAYHVGIYAGHGEFWHAPHSGTVVKKQPLYHARWRFGRIIH